MTLDNIKDWLFAQRDKAKAAWAIVLVIAGALGYSVTVEKQIDNEQSITEIKQVVEEAVGIVLDKRDDEVIQRLELIELNLHRPIKDSAQDIFRKLNEKIR